MWVDPAGRFVAGVGGVDSMGSEEVDRMMLAFIQPRSLGASGGGKEVLRGTDPN